MTTSTIVIGNPRDLAPFGTANYWRGSTNPPTRKQVALHLETKGWGEISDCLTALACTEQEYWFLASGAAFTATSPDGAPLWRPQSDMTPATRKLVDNWFRLMHAIGAGAIPASKAGGPRYDVPTSETADADKVRAVLSELMSSGNCASAQTIGDPPARLRKLHLDGVALTATDAAAICGTDVESVTRWLTQDVAMLPWSTGNEAFEMFRRLMHLGSVGMSTQVTKPKRVVTAGEVY